MATKTISITEETYNMLASWKKENESFSDVIKRLGAKPSLTSFAGILSETRAKELEASIEEGRARSRRRTV
jgi:predicted CopG family antitoxin